MWLERKSFEDAARLRYGCDFKGEPAMIALFRVVGTLLAMAMVIGGGYWEIHHHVWMGVSLALLGIVGLIVMTGAKCGHVQESEEAGLD